MRIRVWSSDVCSSDHRRVAARQGVADDDPVDVGGNVPGQVALLQVDAKGFELGRHRRIDRLVAALDLLVEFARQRCDAAHEGAGDAQYVDFRQDCFLNSEAGVSRSPPRTHTSPRPWSLPGSGFARPAIVTDLDRKSTRLNYSH